MRFQDAARDARAVVYAGIQADPLVARAAELLATARLPERTLARAVMNGETTDADTWREMFPTLFGLAADPAERDRAEAVLAVVARGRRSRGAGPQPGSRCDRRGADRAAPGPSRRAGCRPTRAAGPVRRGPRRDPPLRRHGRARNGAGGIRLQVGRARHQRRCPPPARRRARPCRGRGRGPRGRAGRLRCRAIVRRPPRRPDGAARGHHDRHARDARPARHRTRPEWRAKPTPGRRPTACVSMKPDRTGSSGPRSCCDTRRTWPGTTRRVRGYRPGLVRRTRPGLAGPYRRGHRGGGRPGRRGAGGHHARGRLASRLGPSSHRHSTTRTAPRWPRSRSTGSCSMGAVRPPGSRPSSSPCSARRQRPSDSRAWPSATRHRRRDSRPSPFVRTSWTPWPTSTMRSTPTGSRRR